ncbi:MAG: sigma-70 family RNA polymerase sigma factor [Wenzhouxiangellaceae bacterium]|nr:sigma-70 family RNA polymerase sigma factor [Wenzhouxiangellaceae bacterium]
MDRPPSTDQDNQADGERRARRSFDQLWTRISGHVRFAVSRHRSSDAALAADDLTQEVRIRVWEVYRRDRNSSFNASYYMKVVNSAIIDSLRRHRGTLAHSIREENDDGIGLVEQIDSDEPGPDARMESGLQQARLMVAIEQLPAARGKAVALYLQGFTVAEVAELLKCDENRAHNLTYRGIRDLKKMMGENHDER